MIVADERDRYEGQFFLYILNGDNLWDEFEFFNGFILEFEEYCKLIFIFIIE